MAGAKGLGLRGQEIKHCDVYLGSDLDDDWGKDKLLADLRAGIQATRLVYLLPGDEKAPLTIALRYRRLDTADSYTALSYTWKDTEFDGTKGASEHGHGNQVFFRNGKAMDVTAGLRDALFRIRQAEPERVHVLWADQLCIDQSDVEERGLQVDIMWAIFSKASMVILWLGEEQDDTEQAMELMVKVARHLLDRDKMEMEDSIQERVKKLEQCGSYETWYAAVDHYRRVALTRGWIVQELLLAQQGYTVVRCGSHYIQYMVWQIVGHNLVSSPELGPKFVNFLFMRLSKDRNTIPQAIYENGFQALLFLAGHLSTGRPIPLSTLLLIGSAFDTGDPRDKVYSVLNVHRASLIEDQEPTVVHADYNKTVAETFTNVTQRIIEVEKSLQILNVAGATNAEKHGLQSWVPDYSQIVKDHAQNYARYDIHNALLKPRAAGDTQIAVRWSDQDGSCILQTKSYVLGRVTRIGEPLPRSAQEDRSVCARVLASWVTTASLAPNTTLENLNETGKAFGRMFTRCNIMADELDLYDAWVSRFIMELLAAFDRSSDSVLEQTAQILMRLGDNYETNKIISACSLITDFPFDSTILTPHGPVTAETRETLYIPDSGKLNLLFVYLLQQQEDTDSRLPWPALERGILFQDMKKTWRDSMPPKNCFALDSGHYGLGPLDVAIGDEVHIVQGAGSPFVCRREGPDSPVCQLIGECDVPGVMEGEALGREDFAFTDLHLR